MCRVGPLKVPDKRVPRSRDSAGSSYVGSNCRFVPKHFLEGAPSLDSIVAPPVPPTSPTYGTRLSDKADTYRPRVKPSKELESLVPQEWLRKASVPGKIEHRADTCSTVFKLRKSLGGKKKRFALVFPER